MFDTALSFIHGALSSKVMYLKKFRVIVFLFCISTVSVWAATPEVVRLKLKWKHQFQFAGYYAAIEKGFYAEAGLEVHLLEPKVGEEPMHSVLAGEAEFGVSTSDLILLRGAGEPVVALAVIFQHSPLILLAREDNGISNLHNLVDKRLMLEPHSADLYAMFKNESIPLDRLHLVAPTFSIDELIEKKVDAVSAYSTDEPYSLTQAGIGFVQFSPRSYGIDFYGDGLFTTEEQIAKHPARVKAFREASLRGWVYALDHPEEMADLILAKYSKRKTREHLLYEAQHMRNLIHPELVEVGYMNPGRWRHIAETFRATGMLKGTIDAKEFIYDPNPKFPWHVVWWVGAGGLIFGLIASVVAGYFRRNSLRLAREIEGRTKAEDALQQSESRYRRVYDYAPLAFVISDENLRIVEWNHRAEAMFGWTREEAIGRDVLELLVPPDLRDHVRGIILDGRNQNLPNNSTNQNLNKRGDLIWCEWSNVFEPGDSKHAGNCLSLAMDVTARHTAQEALKTANQDLVVKTTALLAAKKEAEEANLAKSRFLAMMSHEIRTPMNAIIGYAGLLKQADLIAEQMEMVETLEFSAQALTTIVTDILDYSKIEAGRLELEKHAFNLPDMLRTMARLYSPLAERKGLSFDLQFSPSLPKWISSDPTRIGQILSNLLSNAIKFTQVGTVRLIAAITPTKEDSPRLIISIEDTGIGMSPGHLSRLFTPFTQADATISRRYGGTGLGLAISKQLAELMHGSVEVKSEYGVGTSFTVTIPVLHSNEEMADPENPQTARHRYNSVPNAPGMVLVVDDNRANRKLVSLFLQMLGIACETVDDGDEAIARCKSSRYDMIFMDMNMPGINGLEATAAIRQIEAQSASSTPYYIVALTANAYKEDRDRCFNAGMNDFLVKPLRIENINDAIARYVDWKTSRDT